jgi:hypothetical protein
MEEVFDICLALRSDAFEALEERRASEAII